MTTTYDVRLGEVQFRASGKEPRFIVRWLVAGKPKSKSFQAEGLAHGFLLELWRACDDGEAFDVATGLPVSMRGAAGVTVLEFAQSYVVDRWRSSAARTRETDVYGLLSLIPALVADRPGRPPEEAMREVLRNHVLLPADRRGVLLEGLVPVLQWLQGASLPLKELRDPRVARRALEAISVTFAGRDAAANTVRRKRAVLNHLLELAVERKELAVNPLDEIRWSPPKALGAVDPRVVVNPDQARALLAEIPGVGWSRGERLHGLFACLYYAALRPEEAAGLRRRDCDLPEAGWGLLTIGGVRPQANKRWTDSGETHDSRGLKHRARHDVREVPIPPVLVAVLRAHVARYGVADDGRLFHTSTGGLFSSSAYSGVWKEARRRALTPEQVASPLAARPYDLRHAAVSLWLNAGVPPVEVAARAGHGVDVLFRVYAKCMDGQQSVANRKISEVLDGHVRRPTVSPVGLLAL